MCVCVCALIYPTSQGNKRGLKLANNWGEKGNDDLFCCLTRLFLCGNSMFEKRLVCVVSGLLVNRRIDGVRVIEDKKILICMYITNVLMRSKLQRRLFIYLFIFIFFFSSKIFFILPLRGGGFI